MILLISITFVVLVTAMLITAKGIEKKEKASIECELSKYCDLEKQRNKSCSTVKEKSFNYLTMSPSK